MKNDPRPTLDEVTAWLSTQPEIAYSYPWSFVVAALVISIIITITGYTILRWLKHLGK